MIPKFRAWDRTRNEMNYKVMVGNCDTDDENYTCPTIWIEERKKWLHFDDYECIMQSTGIKDKVGNEIFEGDILITNAHASIVSFGEYTYFEDADTEVIEVGFYLSYLNVSPATYSPFEKFFWEKCQVIGNIHENELDLIMYEAWKFNKEMEHENKNIK